MHELSDALERAEPLPETRGDWERVLREARLSRRSLLVGPLAVVIAAAALFALVLFEPLAGERQTFLERALAAVDDGPVIHAVLRHSGSGTTIDLETGERTPVYSENEIWYDSGRGVMRDVFRLGGMIIHDATFEADWAPQGTLGLGRDYRAALESGSARIAEEDVIDGEEVTWVVVLQEMLPDSEGRLHEWTQQVAVSKKTFKPVATRDTRDGRPGRETFQLVLAVEAVPAGDVELKVPKEKTMSGARQRGQEPIAVDRAADVLGQSPLWLGREHTGLPLTKASKTWMRRGTYRAKLLEGRAADEARNCRLGPAGRGEFGSPECERLRERLRKTRGGFGGPGNTVYEYGPVVWGDERVGISFTYGDVDDPFRPLTESTPPHVFLSEARDRGALLNGAAYFPPPGYLSLSSGGRSGSLVVDGVYVVIHASSEELILSAARALEPIPD